MVTEPWPNTIPIIKRLMTAEISENILDLLHRMGHVKFNSMNRVKQWAKRKDHWRKTMLIVVNEKIEFKQASDALTIMFEMGTDVDSRDFENGWMLSHLAARAGNVELLRFIFERYGQFISLYDVGGDGSNVLHVASECCNLEVVKMLVQLFKMDIDVRNRKGQTAREIACLDRNGDSLLDYLL